MKISRKGSNQGLYLRVLLITLLIASLAFLNIPSVIATQECGGENGRGHGVPEQTSLELSKTVEAVADGEVELVINKTADPLEITLNQGESASVVYAIDVSGSTAEEITYTIIGTITAENVGENPAYVTSVWDVVEYKVKGGPWTEAGSTNISDPESPIPVGDSIDYEYRVVFTLPADVTPTAMRNTGYVEISNRGGVVCDEPYHVTESFDVPVPADGELPEAVEVTDVETIDPSDGGVSFSVDSVTWDDGSSTGTNGGPWLVTLPNTITVNKTVTAAEDATPGTYTLHNIAAIVDTELEDSADVTITVPEPEEPTNGEEPGDGGEQPSGNGGGGEEGAAAAVPEVSQAEPAPVPEPVVVSPAVVTQPTAPPEVVAQAPAAIPEKLPYTGLNSWYLSLAILLIMLGFLLQFVDMSLLYKKTK